MSNEEQENRIKDTVLKRIKKLYREAEKDEKERIFNIMNEILEDKYYKENMLYYFKEFLFNRY